MGLTLGSQLSGQTDYQQTFTSFSGADIIATFNERVIGELQAITFSITREKAPVYTMGSADPRSFSRGKRGIAGSLVFTVFDRDSLIDEMKASSRAFTGTAGATIDVGTTGVETSDSPLMSSENKLVLLPNFGQIETQKKVNGVTTSTYTEATNPNVSISQLDTQLTNSILGGGKIKTLQPFQYSDQIPPFHITVTMANEYGQAAFMRILYAEILNEGMGFSIDDIVTEKACTFVARRIEYLKSLGHV